jgi:protein phosphatase
MPSSTSMFIIADGTGIAPSIAIKTVGSDAGVLSDVSLLARAMRKANEKIYRYGQKEGNISGCKFTALLLKENSLTVAHVGDIRVYIINKNKIRQITDDHTPLGKMLKNRKITPKEAGISLRKNIAYRMVGTNPQLEIALYQQKLTGGDSV